MDRRPLRPLHSRVMLAVSIGVLVAGVAIAWLAPSLLAASHAIMYKRDPRSATIWAFVSLLLPLIGPWLYWIGGINRVQRKALRHLGRRDLPFDPPQLAAPQDPAQTEAFRAAEALAQLRKVADTVTRLPLLPGNRIEPLHHGEQAYPAMLAAIARAEHTITLASYIFDWDDVGREFAAALGQAARRGVKVHVLVDGIGAVGSLSRMGRLLLKSKAEVAAFFPLRFPLGRLRINLRNHRKILVADGRTGFTGGMNISARHLAETSDPERVKDLHFQISGPVVAELQHAFVEDWATATGKTLDGYAYFPELAPTGPVLCRSVSSGPDEHFESIHWILLAAFAAARHTIRIITPYFIPTAALIAAMVMAAMRGVQVTLMLPARLDHRYMRWATDAYLWQMLEHGIRVFRHPPPFVHTKLLVVDELWVLFGSANLDIRSFRLHFELNVEAYGPQLAREMSRWFDDSLPACQRVTLEQVDSRSTLVRLRDGLAKLISPHL